MQNFSIFWPLLVSIAAQAVLAWVVYEKLSRAILLARRTSSQESDNAITQIEALLAVSAEMNPTRALPKSRGWAASPDFLATLISIVHDKKPELVVECSSGYSTLVLAAALRNQGRGKVLSLEHDEIYAAKTRGLLELHGLLDWATVIDAPLVPLSVDGWSGSWYSLSQFPKAATIDMLVIDGPPQQTGELARFPAVPRLFEYFGSDAVVILDDADREDEIIAIQKWRAMHPKFQVMRVPKCEKGCVALEISR